MIYSIYLNISSDISLFTIFKNVRYLKIELGIT